MANEPEQGVILDLEAPDAAALEALWAIYGDDQQFFMIRLSPVADDPDAFKLHSFSTVPRDDVIRMIKTIVVPELNDAPAAREP